VFTDYLHFAKAEMRGFSGWEGRYAGCFAMANDEMLWVDSVAGLTGRG
jgi:hypothetical protein